MPFDKDVLTFEQLDAILHYEPETGIIRWKSKTASKVLVGTEAGCVKATRILKSGLPGSYRYIRVLGKSMPAARVAWMLHYGEWPVGKIVFEDKDPLNLKIANLSMSNSVKTEYDHNSPGGRADYLREHRENYPMDWKDSHLRVNFGITLADYGRMLVAQGGVCATCKKEETQTRGGNVKALSVDHDHATGKVRGLLCGHCNTALGKVGDDRQILLNMIAYLDKHAGRESAVTLTVVPTEEKT